MRFRLSKTKSSNGLIVDNDAETVGSAKASDAIFFILRRSIVLLAIGLPALYLLHLILLAVYSRILTNPHYHQYEPFGIHRDLSGSSEHAALHVNPPAHAHIPPPPPTTERVNDVTDTFKNYKNADKCNISSLDLHLPIHPSCDSRQSVLNAMSFGGRAGFDQPFIPFGCDFRWYSTLEVCEVVGRFSHIFVIGDSLQRMIVTAIYTLLRQDIGLGGIGEWDFKPAEVTTKDSINTLEDCMCDAQFTKHECSHAPVFSYSDAVEKSQAHNKPACGSFPASDSDRSFDISYHEIQKYPATEENIEDLLSAVKSTEKPHKPMAFILHHTFWNDVNITATVDWIDQLQGQLIDKYTFLPRPDLLTHYPPSTRGFPRLFVTANAAGVMKDSLYLDTQNSNAVARFEAALKPHLEFRDIDLLGFFNMSVQTTSSDGTHANMRTNLVKAMMVLNWLDWAGREEGETWDQEGSAAR